jgi:putative tryptophan/tyrosine transport system substrate-binding protein
MRRRDFLTVLGGAAAAWPLAARAQQPAMPVVGFLSIQSAGAAAGQTEALRRGLAENGYIEGRNITILYRWAEGNYERLPALAAELIQLNVHVIFAGGPPAVRAAMAATSTTPIVFNMGEDPVNEGIVASLNRPGGNVTGYTNFTNQLVPKRLELLRELVPGAAELGFLANQTNPNFEPDTAQVQAAAEAMGLRLRQLTASIELELESAFVSVVQLRVGALLVGVDPWFRDQRARIVALAAHHGVPTSYERRDFVEAGGLMSYGTDEKERGRVNGLYIARILKGEKSADLPVVQPTKFEFVLNLKAAKALRLDVPTSILLRADEVIE